MQSKSRYNKDNRNNLLTFFSLLLTLLFTLYAPTPQNGQTHSNNLCATVDQLFEFVWPFCGVSAYRVKINPFITNVTLPLKISENLTMIDKCMGLFLVPGLMWPLQNWKLNFNGVTKLKMRSSIHFYLSRDSPVKFQLNYRKKLIQSRI